MQFRDRADAGRRLARRLGHLAGGDPVVLGPPRGGVLVAEQVAAVLGAARDWSARAGVADETVCVESPDVFFGVGRFYADFSQSTDEEVVACLDRAAGRDGPPAPAPAAAEGRPRPADPAPGVREVEVPAGAVRLGAVLTVPERPLGIVVFAHGSGSGRHSPRNRSVAGSLNRAGLPRC